MSDMKYSGERFLPGECTGEIAAEHCQRYQLACQAVCGKTVLDAACGEGYGSSLLARYAETVFGVDIDGTAVENALAKYGNENLSFIKGSIAKLPFGDSFFDVVVSFETIEHVDGATQQLFLMEVKRVLKPGGILIMSTPNKAVYTDMVSGYNRFHIKEFYADEYRSFLQSQFRYVQMLCQYPDTGYFIARENEASTAVHPGCSIGHSRYVIAVCSNAETGDAFDTESCTCFNDSMYYSLYSEVHRLEKELMATKEEADAFQDRLEDDITGQKQYIEKLENTILEQKDYVSHLETDLSSQGEYIHHLESDISSQKEYACRLEADISNQKEYIQHLEADLQANISAMENCHKEQDERSQYIRHLEVDLETQKEYILHLEADLKELTGYARHLEADIGTLREQLPKTGETQDV